MTVAQLPAKRVCIICCEDLPPGASKCTKCGSFQRQCGTCGMPMPDVARRCPTCHAFQEEGVCESCGLPMPAQAKRCPECQTYKGRRGWIQGSEVVLALLISLLSVIGAVAPAVYAAWNSRSDTYARILGPAFIAADGDPQVPVILVLAVNRGARPSLVRSGTLTLIHDKETILTAQLTVANVTEQLVPAMKTTVVQLTTKDVATGHRMDDVLARLEKGTVNVTLNVEETGRLGGQFFSHPQDDARGKIIAALVRKRVPK